MQARSGSSNGGASAPSIDLATVYMEVCAELEKAELRAAELRGQKALVERLINTLQRPVFSGDPLDDRDLPAEVRDDRDVLMSRLGEAQQGLTIADEAHQAPPSAARPAPKYIGDLASSAEAPEVAEPAEPAE